MRTKALAPRKADGKRLTKRTRPYRIDSRTKKLTALGIDVHKLVQQITRLEQLREMLRAKTLSRAETTTGSIAQTIRTYFQVFAHGYHPTVRLARDRVVETDRFVASVVDDDVLGGGFRGVATLMANWKRFNAVFTNLALRLTDVAVVPLDETDDGDGRVLATATATHVGHITLKTLEMLFPHILHDASMVLSILGRPVAGAGRTTFVYDCGRQKITSILIDIDMVATFATVVRRPSDLAVLFDTAQITREGFIGDRDSIPADKALAPARIDQANRCPREAMSLHCILSPEHDA